MARKDYTPEQAIGMLREAEVLRHGRVHQAEGVREVRAIEDGEPVPFAERARRADEIAEPVNRAKRRITLGFRRFAMGM